MNRIIAHFLSIVFHPLIVTTYIVTILLMLNPFLFGKNDVAQGWALILQVFFSTFCLPAMAVAMMKGLGLIDSFQMEDRRERIIPYIATATFYLWIFMSIRTNTTIPTIFTAAMLGTIISLFITFFINNFSKISAHAVGMGGLVGIIVVALRWVTYSFFYVNFFGQKLEIASFWVLISALLIAGSVCSARLWLQAHELKDIIGCFMVGLFGQWAAMVYLL